MSDFVGNGGINMSYKPFFKEGDIIEFCDDQFVVLKDFGYSGKVQENCKNGAIVNCYWEFQGERCKLVKDGIDRR